MQLLPGASAHATGKAGERQPADFRLTDLVVDDHDGSRFLIRYLMERGGYRVIEAVDRLEAMEMAHHS